MLGSYYSKAFNSKEIFDKLRVSNSLSYLNYLNKYNVISISFSKIPEKGNTYSEYIEMIKDSLINDIVEKYPQINPDKYYTISDMLDDTETQMKEKEYFEKFAKEYTEFLAVAICYDSKIKEHKCKIESIEIIKEY